MRKLDEPKVLVSCDAESEWLVQEELRRIGGVDVPGIWLDTGDAVQGSIALHELSGSFSAFSADVERVGSIFIRHVAPVEFEVELQGEAKDIDSIVAIAPELASGLQPDRTFSVQSRILGEGKLPFRKVVLNETLSQALTDATGATMECRHPEQVVSILCTAERAYVGSAPTSELRSEWPGGKHRFKREDDQISRAEFKLLEAESVFGLRFPAKGRALDIGAAPGGWTRILADRGMEVDAVDPGELDPRLRRHPRVHHHRCRIQDYSSGSKPFDVIVNDMKMDARDSVEIMLSMAPRLAEGGLGVITLKLPKAAHSASTARKLLDMIRLDLNRLATGFEILGTRQLYHNRSEVTVALAKA